MNNAKLLPFQKRITKLLKEKDELEQMSKDVKFCSEFRRLLVHEGCD